jgi:hypothetical protein
MTYQLLTALFLASLAQEKRVREPIPPPPAGIHIVSTHVNIAGRVEARQITLSMPPLDDEDEEPLAARDMRFNILTSVLEPDNFDRWLFCDDQSEADRHRRLDGLLRSRVDTVTEMHKLTDPQRAKLRLAGRGDIKRFFDQVEDRRPGFEKHRHNFGAGFAALQRLNPLMRGYREGPFGDGSLFAKTLATINSDQK